MAAPPRVVSLHPAGTDILASLGLQSLLVGRSHECDAQGILHVSVCTESKLGDSTELSSVEVDAAAAATTAGLWEATCVAGAQTRERASLEWGLSVYRTRLETLRSLRPDVVLTQVQCSSGALSIDDALHALNKLLGFAPKLVQLEAENIGNVWTDMQKVADACGAPSTGRMVVDNCRRRLDAVASRVASLPRPRVTVIQWPAPIYAAGAWMPGLIDIAGGIDALRVPPGGASLLVTPQELCAAAPEVIIVALCGMTMAQAKGAAPELVDVLGAEAWSRLPAVRANRVYAVDAVRLFSRACGALLADSAEVLASILHGWSQERLGSWCSVRQDSGLLVDAR
jgi:iron complex transport system substrate-binding protein